MIPYRVARRSFPDEVFSYLVKRAAGRRSVLDVGCGTGIATRQLIDWGFKARAVDIDSLMVNEAKRASRCHGIEFFVASARKLPLPNNSQDIVTAFSALHWFNDDESLSEISRVLKAAGLFFVVNKYDRSHFKSQIKNVLVQFATKDVTRDPKANYDPVSILRRRGFVGVTEYVTQIEEEYSIEEANLYVRSTNYWHYVPKNKRPAASRALRKMLEGLTQSGRVKRPINIVVTSGYHQTESKDLRLTHAV